MAGDQTEEACEQAAPPCSPVRTPKGFMAAEAEADQAYVQPCNLDPCAYLYTVRGLHVTDVGVIVNGARLVEGKDYQINTSGKHLKNPACHSLEFLFPIAAGDTIEFRA